MKPINRKFFALHSSFLLKLCLGISAVCLIISLSLNRIDLMYRAMYFLVPFLISSYIIVKKDKILQQDNVTENKKNSIHLIPLRLFALIYVLLYTYSILVLVASSTRPLIYFILIITLIVVTFVEIIIYDTNETLISNGLLLQILLLSVNLIFGVTLNYELFFGGTDIFGHMRIIDVILTHKHLTTDMGSYYYYPLYHLLLALSINILSISKFKAMFLVCCLLFQFGIIISYLTVKELSNDNKIALLSILLLMSSQEYIYYGTYVITRTVAAIIFMLIFYISIKNIMGKKLIFKLITIFLFWILIIYHHVSLIFILPLMIVFYLLDTFYSTSAEYKVFTRNQISLLAICFLFYAFFIAYSFSQSVLIMSLKSAVVDEFMLGTPQLANVQIFLLNNMNSSVYLLFYVLGVYLSLNNGNIPSSIKKITIFSLIFLSVYVPSPIGSFTLFNDILRFDRWKFLISPIMSVIMAYGVLYILKVYNIKKSLPILVFLIIIFSFSSIMCSSNAPDFPLFQDKNTVSTRYFTISELNAINFMSNKTRNGPYFSDFFVYRFIGEKPKINMINENLIHNGSKGYILIRDREWDSRNLLILERDAYPLRIAPIIKTDKNDVSLRINHNMIYNNNFTKIYYGV